MTPLVFTICLFFSICYSSTALTCINCAVVKCKAPEGCKAGTVKGFCGCCDICAQASGEVCGGILLNSKKCGNELTCVKNKSTDLMGICRPKCGPVCEIFCRYGHVLDKNGCPTCSCKGPPICGPVCDIFCPFGHVLDGNGCPTCRCKNLKICGPVCDIFCPYGHMHDGNGCPTCRCKGPPICRPVCEIFCPFGHVFDGNGCPTCRCNRPPKCGPVCMIFCENGNILDERGCPTCGCINREV